MPATDLTGIRQAAASIARSLLIFAFVCCGFFTLFWFAQPVTPLAAPIPASSGDTQLIVEGGKEFSSIVSMLTTLTTGLFVLVALVVRGPMRPSARCPPGQIVLLVLFVSGASGAFFMAMHAKYTIAEGILARSTDLEAVGERIGTQAWFTALAGAAAIALIGEALVTFRKDADATPH